MIKITNVQYLQERSVGMSKEEICAKHGIANTKSLRDYYLPMWGLRTADDEIKALREYRGIKMPQEKKRTIFDKPREASMVSDHKEELETKEEPTMNTETIINQKEDTSFAVETIKEAVHQHEQKLVNFHHSMLDLALQEYVNIAQSNDSRHTKSFSKKVAEIHKDLSELHIAYEDKNDTETAQLAAHMLVSLFALCGTYGINLVPSVHHLIHAL